MPDPAIPRTRSRPPTLTRRRVLSSLGLLIGASVMAPLLARRSRERATRLEVGRRGLGTWIRIVVRDSDPARARAAIADAFAAIDLVDAQMSVHRATSQLTQVNRAAGALGSPVDGAVVEVVAMACAAAQRTDGIYDPTVLPLMLAYGYYDSGRQGFPTDAAIGRALDRVGFRRVVVDRTRGTIGLECEHAGLDLGSIGKGWAVDRAADRLRAAGIQHGLVDAGGNVYAFGTPEEGADGWSVGVLHPATRQIDRVFTLRESAVATSGNAEQFRILSGVRVGHLFDARRGRPSDGHLSVTIQARNGVEADVMSTVAYLLGPDRFRWPEAQAVHFIG